MNLYTIGFTHKTAEQFFEKLLKNGIKRLIDIRLNNRSQLAGFTKAEDLKYFLKKIGNIEYIYISEFAPTKELLNDYKDRKIKWEEYEKKYKKILEDRKIADDLDFDLFNNACLLCSEDSPEKCHRRLVAEYIKEIKNNINIFHL